jgi:redox-sensitive bicupin YhaK (pirin superfamily)
MVRLRPSAARGHADHGWLDTRHTFSFAEYHDPQYMGWRSLRVINEDRVAAGQGFGTHGHRDMEILSYVVSGALTHRDSMGHAEALRPGEVQVMSAGRGVTHSEYNGSPTEPVHFLQIWILPDQAGHEPRYEQKAYPAEARQGRLCLVASPDGAQGSMMIHQDARVYATLPAPGETIIHPLADGRGVWVQVVGGAVTVNGVALAAGDGAAVEEEAEVALAASEAAEVLVFDLA